jgi:hypothetical protein
MIPALAQVYLPMLMAVTTALWPTMPDPALLAAQVEQETCISLKHSKCWNPRAELKTSREYGFGLGQLTVTPRFDNFKESKGWDKTLAGWTWENRYDPEMQLRALVAYDRNLHRQVKAAATADDRMAFTFSAYNGGMGGVLKDRVLCGKTAGCDPAKWLGNVEHTSFRAKTSVKGYGKSFFAINREYVHNIMVVRSPKYREAL